MATSLSRRVLRNQARDAGASPSRPFSCSTTNPTGTTLIYTANRPRFTDRLGRPRLTALMPSFTLQLSNLQIRHGTSVDHNLKVTQPP